MSTAIWSAKKPPVVSHVATSRASAQVTSFAGAGSRIAVIECMTDVNDGAGRPMGSGASPG